MTQIIVTQQVAQVVVDEDRNVVVVSPRYSSVVEAIAQGPQGPPGSAATGYVHSQPSPSATWTIAHNLGFNPIVELLNSGSQEIDGDVVHISYNVTMVYFTTPIAGFARLI